MPKKTATAKKKTAKKTAGSKRGPGRPKGSKNKATKTVSKPSTKKAAKKTAKKSGSDNRGKYERNLNPDTGFIVDSDSDLIAQALLEGGESRVDIARDLEDVIGTETRNGNEKNIQTMVSSVANKMVANGFTIEQSFRVVPPTAASKRAAKKAPAKKTAAKKGKRGPGRPKGSKNKK